RKFHNPAWQTALYGSVKYHEEKDVAKTIAEAKKNNMKVLLDLHYSDSWADPHKQETPQAWKNLPLNILKDSVYQYTYNYLQYLVSEDLIPEYIQIGNDTCPGMCHPAGRIEQNDFSAFCTLLAAESKAV